MKELNVKILGSGTYLPGEPIPLEKVDEYLGELTDAPSKIQKWLKMTKGLMGQMLDVEYYHFAIDPVTRVYGRQYHHVGESCAKGYGSGRCRSGRY